MSPVPTVTREQHGGRATPVLPFPLPLPVDVRIGPDREIVVDWQMPADVQQSKN